MTSSVSASAAAAAAAELLARASRVVVFTGAGVSADSGIGTFRGRSNGFWAGITGTLAMVYFGTTTGWRWTPGFTWGAYVKHFYAPIQAAQPNDGHRAIAELRQIVRQPVHIVTQNVDGLHQRAGSPPEEVHEVHGTIMRHRCIAHGHPAADRQPADILASTAPRCQHDGCGSYLRPDAVLFGEALPSDVWEAAMDAVQALCAGDVLIVAGTSGVVYPAASIPEYAARRGAHIVECNLDQPTLDGLVRNNATSASRRQQQQYVFVPGPSAQTLPAIVAQLHVLRAE